MSRLWAILTAAGWACAGAALYWLAANEERHAEREAVLWGQMDRYQRMVTPHQGFSSTGEVVRDDTNGDTEPSIETVPRQGGFWGENLARG